MNKLIKKSIFLSLVMIMFFTTASFADIRVERISGEDRYETSAKVATYAFDASIPSVLIASGENYPDALFGGVLSADANIPLLLVNKDYLSDKVVDALIYLNPKSIYVLGGVNTISDSNLKNLKHVTGAKIIRVAGKDRIETAEKIHQLRLSINGITQKNLEGITNYYNVGINAYNFYDALYAGPFVGQFRNDNNWIFKASASKPKVKDFTYGITIGEIEVADQFATEVIRGKNRYETSVLIAKEYKTRLKLNPIHIVLVSGDSYPDGLSSSIISGFFDAPVLLTKKDYLDPSIVNYIKNNKELITVFVIGGEKVISNNVINQIKNIK